MKRLELRRQELVLQSTLNRLVIREELQKVQIALRPAERVVCSVRAARSWLVLLAPVAGILAARGLRNNGAGFSKVIGMLKWIQPLLALWKQFKSFTTEAATEPTRRTTAPNPRV